MASIADKIWQMLSSEGVHVVPAEEAREWMRSANPEIRDAMYVLLSQRKGVRVEPQLTNLEASEYLKTYLKDAVRGGTEQLTRHGAALEMASWLVHMVDDPSSSPEAIRAFVRWFPTCIENSGR